MNSDSKLTGVNLKFFSSLSNKLNLDEETRKYAKEILEEFIEKKNDKVKREEFDLSLRTAILIASKGIEVETVTGKKARGIGLSPMKIIADSPFEMSQLVLKLKEFLKNVTVDKELETELKRLVDRFNFNFHLYRKYEEITQLMKFSFTGVREETGRAYYKLFKEYGWLLFVLSKQDVLENHLSQIHEYSFLMATLFHFLIVEGPHNVYKPIYFDYLYEKYPLDEDRLEDEMMEEVMNGLKEIFKIQDTPKFLEINDSFRKFIEKLNEEGMINEDSLKLNKLQSSYKKLDYHYQKKLGIDELDERFFIKDRKKHLTPSKFTPFSKQGAANKHYFNYKKRIGFKGNKEKKFKNLNSHRVLNYEVPPKMKIKSNFKEIKFSGMVQSPYTFKTMAKTTPMTAVMEMYHWLQDKFPKKKGIQEESEEGKIVIPPKLEKYLSILDTQTQYEILNNTISPLADKIGELERLSGNQKMIKKEKDRKKEILLLYLKVLEMVLTYSERKNKNINLRESLKNKKLHKGLYICCAESYYFIMNLNLLTFETMMEEAEIEPLHMWRVIYTFLRFDSSMHSAMKKHFLDLEIHVLSYLSWTDEQTIKSFMSNLNEDKENNGKSPLIKSTKKGIILPEFKFFSRVLHHTATQMYHLASGLKLQDDIIEEVWTLIKYVFTEKIHILVGRHIDQIIFCAIYVICKIFKNNIKFQEIINTFNKLPLANKSKISEILYSVILDNPENRGDIITFYNKVFISQMKQYFSSFSQRRRQEGKMKENQPSIKKIEKKGKFNSQNILQSPLKELVSSPFFVNHPAKRFHTNFGNIPKNSKSPTSKMLVMKKEYNSGYKHIIPESIKSKKVINFDDTSFESQADKDHGNLGKKDEEFLSKKFAMMRVKKSNNQFTSSQDNNGGLNYRQSQDVKSMN